MSKLYIIILLSFVSCNSKTFSSKDDLFDFLNNPKNEYVSSKVINGVKFQLFYKPTDLMVSEALPQAYDNTIIDSLETIYEQYVYFKLNLSKGNEELLSSRANNKQKFSEMVNELSFNLKDKIHLTNKEKDTLFLKNYHYSRMYGMTTSTSILLAFDRKKILENEKVYLKIEDFGFGTGDVQLVQKVDPIRNQPHLKF